MSNKMKLELSWIGKDRWPRLEPRILLPNLDKSYHAQNRVGNNDIFENKLIHGDNLLAVDVEFGVEIFALAIEAEPVIEARAGSVGGSEAVGRDRGTGPFVVPPPGEGAGRLTSSPRTGRGRGASARRAAWGPATTGSGGRRRGCSPGPAPG